MCACKQHAYINRARAQHRGAMRGDSASHVDWCASKWARCSEAWGDVGPGNQLVLFHDVEAGRYRVEMELCADLVSLVALVCELNFLHTWCPFVQSSDQAMDTEFLLSECLVHRLVVHPVCRFLIGVMVLYVKQTHSKEDACWCVEFEDMHRTKPRSLHASYLSFDNFVLRFERDALQNKTCCSCEIRFQNVFAYVPAVLLFVVCREMIACFVRKWTASAQQLHMNSLDMFALNKHLQRKASHYIDISRHIGAY